MFDLLCSLTKLRKRRCCFRLNIEFDMSCSKNRFRSKKRLKLVLYILCFFVCTLFFYAKFSYVLEDIGLYLNFYGDPFETVLQNSATRRYNSKHYFPISHTGNQSSSVKHPLNNTRFFKPQPGYLRDCLLVPPNLVGPIQVREDQLSMNALEKEFSYLEKGGHGKPKYCMARHRVAIVIPFFNRDQHLRILLQNLLPLLTRQELDYVIIVVEQTANQTFNRAKLINIGFVEALKLYPFECFIFHDVDLLPKDDRNLYSCPTNPRHMSYAMDKFNYKLPYATYAGGVIALSVEQMQKINGMSNEFWGWGGEDDDLATRIELAGFSMSRYPRPIARYKMIKHEHEKSNPINPCRHKLITETSKRWRQDGLNSLHYEVVNITALPLYTHITVDLKEESLGTKEC